jgi:hypothetical protein
MKFMRLSEEPKRPRGNGEHLRAGALATGPAPV